MSTVARIIFQYDENPNTEETVRDLDALDSKLEQGSVIERNGRRWRVMRVDVQRPTDDPDESPIWLVHLRSVA